MNTDLFRNAVELICDERIKAAVAKVERGPSFDMFRVSKGKKEVDITANTLRAYGRKGLRLYKNGKVVFVSKAELIDFIKRTST